MNSYTEYQQSKSSCKSNIKTVGQKKKKKKKRKGQCDGIIHNSV